MFFYQKQKKGHEVYESEIENDEFEELNLIESSPRDKLKSKVIFFKTYPKI